MNDQESYVHLPTSNAAILQAALSSILLINPTAVLAGELEVHAESAYSTQLPWSPTVIPMFESSKLFDTIDVISGKPRPTLKSPDNSQVDIGGEFITSAWASASPGVLKTKSIITANPVAVGSSPSFFGATVWSGAYFGDSLTYSEGGSRDFRLKISFSVPHTFSLTTRNIEILSSADDGNPDTPVPYRGYAEDFTTGLYLNYESSYVDRDLVNRPGINQEFKHIKATCGACSSENYNEFPDGKITVYVPFIEGLPFSYGVSMTAYAGIYRDKFGFNMGAAPALGINSSGAAVFADRSLYFDSAIIIDDAGNEYSLNGLKSSLGINYSQSSLVPEPSTYALLIAGFLVIFGWPAKNCNPKMSCSRRLNVKVQHSA
jgi:hypothetical protein